MRRRIFMVALCATAGLCTPALAARNAELSIVDDQLLLGAPQDAVDARMAEFRALGIDRVRVSAFWSSHAPGGTTKPAGFDSANSADPLYDWSALDRVIGSARAHGLRVMLSISTPAPLWGTSRPSRNNPVERPRPDEFARFATAAATRYRDQVDQYGLLNEPNQGAWLQPQHDGRGKLVSPHLYRSIARPMYLAIKAADPGSVVLLGELAPSGRSRRDATSPVRPLEFLRAMGCRDRRMRALRTGPCRGFKAPYADAVGHHPYALFQSPFAHSRERDDAAIGDTGRLLATLDRLSARRAILGPRRLDVHFTEFGYQTDPPDPYAGVPLGRQSRWLQEAAYVSWRLPRVRALNQFRLVDGAIDRSRGLEGYREFQSGLLFVNGRQKPAYRTFPNPFVLTPAGRLWGQVRPGARHTVTIERRTGTRFSRAARLRTDVRGYFQTRKPVRTGLYRYRWEGGTSQILHKRR
jgi:hypothetical protein